MTLDIEYEADEQLDIDCAQLASLVAEKVLEREGCPYEAEVDLVLTTEEEIKDTNLEFREINAPTDVLSFPMIFFEQPADFSVVDDSGTYFNPDTGELLLGDIMISVPRVKKQAAQYGHSIKREFCFLIAHSMLHLLGYDHMTEAEAAVMEEKQREVLDELGIRR